MWESLETGGVVSTVLILAVTSTVLRLLWGTFAQPSFGKFKIPRQGDPLSLDITIFDFPKLRGLAASPSPFVSKLETWMRFNDLKYTKSHGLSPSAPFKKLPFIKHGGKLIPDSAFIIKYLSATFPEKVVKLSPEQQAQAAALTALLDYRFSCAMIYCRWMRPEGLQGMVNKFFHFLPPGAKWLVPRIVRSKVYRTLKGWGFADFSEEDFLSMVEADAATLSTILGDKPYLTGDVPSTADASLFAILDNVLNDGFMPLLPAIVHKHPNLVSFTQRVRAKYYPDRPVGVSDAKCS